MSYPSKQHRRRLLQRRQGLESLFHLHPHQASDAGRLRAAWLMVAVHAFRVISQRDDAHALSTRRSELVAIVPKDGTPSCGRCAVCEAVGFCVRAYGEVNQQSEVTMAAACSAVLDPAVRTALHELCGVAGVVVARAHEVAYKQAVARMAHAPADPLPKRRPQR